MTAAGNLDLVDLGVQFSEPLLENIRTRSIPGSKQALGVLGRELGR